MGTLSIAQTDHLFWLGRYLERVLVTLDLSSEVYDLMLDGAKDYDIKSLCKRLAIPEVYENSDDFISRYMYDAGDPNSVVSNLNRAFDNAVVMRDVLTSHTLCYIELAMDKLKQASRSVSPMLEVQETVDYLYAFWGAVEDNVWDVKARYIMRTGRSIERLDLYLRLRLHEDKIAGETTRLINRIYRSEVNYDPEAFQRLVECSEMDAVVVDPDKMLNDLNNLVITY